MGGTDYERPGHLQRIQIVLIWIIKTITTLNVLFCKTKLALNTQLAKQKTSEWTTYGKLIQIRSMSFELFTSFEISAPLLLFNKIFCIMR